MIHQPLSAPRIYTPLSLQVGAIVDLPASAVRHIQVLRMQPKQVVTLFSGQSGEWHATIVEMGKNHVKVEPQIHHLIEREATTSVTLLVGIPVNERMDFLIEKATELGVAEIYPLIFERSVFKLNPQRAEKKQQQWQDLVISACEQCGRNKIPTIHPITKLSHLLQNKLSLLPKERRVLSLEHALPWSNSVQNSSIAILSGPEGGLAPTEEEQLTHEADFQAYTLGNRVLRADTAPLAALASLTL